jgi:hypothetical protein
MAELPKDGPLVIPAFFMEGRGVFFMLYVSICKAKKDFPKMAKTTDIKEWVKVCKDQPLHKKCKMIKCFETVGDSPHELLLMFDTNEPDALNLLSDDFGEDWDLKTYPLHEIPEWLEEDHSIIGG